MRLGAQGLGHAFSAGAVCTIKVAYGIAGEILWLSHVGLFIAAVGFLRRSALLVRAALIAIGLFAVLTTAGRALLPPDRNVNFAFGVHTTLDWPLLDRVNALPAPVYLVALNAAVSVLFFLPIATIRLHPRG